MCATCIDNDIQNAGSRPTSGILQRLLDGGGENVEVEAVGGGGGGVAEGEEPAVMLRVCALTRSGDIFEV
jgi:hypothetical protein